MEQIKRLETANGNSEDPAKSDSGTNNTARHKGFRYTRVFFVVFIFCSRSFQSFVFVHLLCEAFSQKTYSQWNSPDMNFFWI